jgi:hypothetical protein
VNLDDPHDVAAAYLENTVVTTGPDAPSALRARLIKKYAEV